MKTIEEKGECTVCHMDITIGLKGDILQCANCYMDSTIEPTIEQLIEEAEGLCPDESGRAVSINISHDREMKLWEVENTMFEMYGGAKTLREALTNFISNNQ